MKIIPIYILSVFLFLVSTLAMTHASSSDKGESSATGGSHTQHPPHDHHEPDHIKKLDESMRRKREDEEKSH